MKQVLQVYMNYGFYPIMLTTPFNIALFIRDNFPHNEFLKDLLYEEKNKMIH